MGGFIRLIVPPDSLFVVSAVWFFVWVFLCVLLYFFWLAYVHKAIAFRSISEIQAEL